MSRDLLCEMCGSAFRVHGTRAANARYCSLECKGVASRKTRTCETCGAEYYGGGRGKRWCSRACSGIAHDKRIERECLNCGDRFRVSGLRVAKGEGAFCSLACHNANQGRGKTEHTCKMCGGVFHWSPSRTASGKYNVKYCSLICRDADPDRLAMLVSMNAVQQLGRTTRAELAGYALLDSIGVDYLRQSPFAGKFTPDAVIPSVRLVVQFDGDYWHDRKGTSTEARIRRRVALDQSQDRYVRACGWEVVRLWESDLRNDPDGCARRVNQLVHRPLGDEPSRDPLARP